LYWYVKPAEMNKENAQEDVKRNETSTKDI